MTPIRLATIATALVLANAEQFFSSDSPSTLADAAVCKLSQKAPANIQSKNGLNLCTQYATNTCCTALHDRLIYAYVHTDSQDSTPDLRNYMCFGCAPTQPDHTDTVNKKITIC